MTGKERKPQVPQGKQTTTVRQRTDWQDSTYPSDALYGRERKYELYDIGIETPAPLVPRNLRLEVAERLRADPGDKVPEGP